ncbi:hypothetical protein BU25DRAFT_456620 [Macroventuria anomochaeta]|uniref:Uncharacterized protein n=1 Tax=Macroventuria anomochaeta TaxID=301207 RepID=A0ACB6S648_9PLEO|nr:uncharacterized protein BU25DRAFT_456620 [Macroventuria anomochaeta]KAF2629524.1 hypothetical protein BU25DRAFT_456620 [Macroventuria anomochaeta]
MAPGGFASIALARQLSAERIDRTTKNSWKIVKQVRFEIPADTAPTTSQLPSEFAASPRQMYSPTSAPVSAQRALNASGVALATATKRKRTPTEQFERMLGEELEKKRRVETDMVAKAVWW